MQIISTTTASIAYPIAVIVAQAPVVSQEQQDISQEVRILSTGISADVFGSIRIGQGGIQFLNYDGLESASTVQNSQLDEAESRAEGLADGRMRNEALAILSNLRDGLSDVDGELPIMSTSKQDDGSFIIEFITSEKRAGFTIEPEEGQSGWFFASLDGSGPVSASGSLGFLEPIELLKRLADAHSPNIA